MKKALHTELAQKIAQSQLPQAYPINLADIDLSKDILTDQDVKKIFGISDRTLANHRKNGLISYFKLGSKTLYLKTVLMLDILKNYND